MAVLLAALAASCGGAEQGAACPGGGASRPPERLVPEVVRRHPHDPAAFTQGLLFVGDDLWESTGMEGASTLRRVDLASGRVEASADLPADVFGEGLALGADDRLVQLSWKEGRAFVWDTARLEVTGEHAYDGEGWGLTTTADGRLLMSDGSATLTLRDPATFEPEGTVEVTRGDGAADQLNELEADGDVVWANRYQTAEVLRIDARCGTVTGVVDATALQTEARATAAEAGRSIDVLNGIAKVPGTDRFLLTGKYWPTVFEVELVPA